MFEPPLGEIIRQEYGRLMWGGEMVQLLGKLDAGKAIGPKCEDNN